MKKNCVFLSAGRLIYRKGQTFLLDVLEQLPNDYDYEFRIVGEGPDKEELMRKCESTKKLKNHVTFVGAIPYAQMIEEYEKTDVFVLPSIRETTGNVLLEAMSRGIPVVTLDAFGGATFIDDRTGWLYKGKTKDEICNNLKNILIECINNPDKVKEKGICAKNKAVELSWSRKVAEFNDIYQLMY